MLGARLISIAIGYIFGLFQTGYLYSRSKGVDIRTQGSGNSGTTNTLRVLGKKAGAITFIGDLLKAILAVIVVGMIFKKSYPDQIRLLELYGGFGAVLGHNFPFYLKFKGGKGIACTGGVVLAVCPLAAPLCLIAFAGILYFTGYVSLGSLAMAAIFLTEVIIFNALGWLHMAPSLIPEYDLIALAFTAMAFWRHRANISRLLNGTENRFNTRKK